MELIYMYLGNINRSLNNQGILFSRKFNVNYNAESRELTISKQETNGINIYGEQIENLNLLVGQNGTGKSTILDLLGLPRQNRLELLPLQKDNEHKYTWFAVYHLWDNLFAVEGYWIEMLRLFDKDSKSWQSCYTAAIRYDLNSGYSISEPEFLQFVYSDDEDEALVPNRLFYILYEPERSTNWYSKSYHIPKLNDSYDHIKRIYAGHGLSNSNFEGIVRYLYDSVHDRQFASKIASKLGTEITIQLKQTNKSEFTHFVDETVDQQLSASSSHSKKEILEKLLYGNRISLMDSGSFAFTYLHSAKEKIQFTYSEMMVLIYLEELVCYFIFENNIWPEEYRGENIYHQRKEYLLEILKDCNSTDYSLAKEIIKGIKMIPDRYFVSGTKASIPIYDMQIENFLTTLACALDKNEFGENEINHHYYVRLSFVGLSTGEAQYLDLHAALYQAIKAYQNKYHRGDTCVLLLDEPDCRFHPEWSRNFIQNLKELLNTETFREYHYQVIISTHSPILVSDVVKESIHCLHRNKDGSVSIQSSNYGLMSNLSNLFTDTFFSQSVFGAFAEQYANTLIQDINAAAQKPNLVTEQQIEGMRNRSYLIEDTVIRKSLDIMLRRLAYKIKERRQKKNDSDLY